MTKTTATAAARKFVATYVRTGRQWTTADLAGCLPRGFDLDEEFVGNPTIQNVADHLAAYAYEAA